MNSRHLIPFTVACTIGKSKIVAHAVIDKKNTSVHLHLYGEIFGNKRMPIQVKNSNMEIIDGKETELITQVLTAHFSGQMFKLDKIEKKNDQKELKKNCFKI